jgi:phosphate transport system substrate-binding protein
MKKLLLTGLLGLATLTANAADSTISLTASGSTFVQPAMEKWASDFTKVDSAVKINYGGGGSGQGQKDIMNGTVEFAASDAVLSDTQIKDAAGKGVNILHLPVVAGAVVVIYNVPGVSNLKLDGPTLANIFLGKITKWSDPAIASQNPGVKLPDTDISTVHRADSSGTSYIFTDYLSNVSPDWKKSPGTSTSPEWPGSNASGAPKSAGVAGQVQKTVGGIGYVELIYALSNKMTFADMKNAAGKYVTASLDSVKEALATASIPDDFRFSFVNAPGDKSYPISGCTWLLVNQHLKDPVKGKATVDFIKWIYGNDTAKADAAALNYAPLPEALVTRVMASVATIK